MPSFDVVSKVEIQEVHNSIQQCLREIGQRYDFKGSKSTVEFKENELVVLGDDEYKLGAIKDILLTKLNKRGISPKSLDMGKLESAANGMIRQNIKIIQGLEGDKCREVNKFIKELKLKVTSETLKEQLRVSGKSRDDLQTVMSALRGHDFGPPLQFLNFRD